MTDLRRPALLDLARHARAGFQSGDAVLDEWLRRYAGQNRRRDTAATWVIADASDGVVAYAMIAITAVDRATAPDAVGRQAADPVPALLIGRLAVDERHAGRGVGTSLVKHVLATAVELNTKAACRAVIVSAQHAVARGRWERLGFTPLGPASSQSLDLYLLTADIEQTLRRLL